MGHVTYEEELSIRGKHPAIRDRKIIQPPPNQHDAVSTRSSIHTTANYSPH